MCGNYLRKYGIFSYQLKADQLQELVLLQVILICATPTYRVSHQNCCQQYWDIINGPSCMKYKAQSKNYHSFVLSQKSRGSANQFWPTSKTFRPSVSRIKLTIIFFRSVCKARSVKKVKGQRIEIFKDLKNIFLIINQHSLKSYQIGNIEKFSKEVFLD